ncbi:MAG: aminotransferase class I/II-fold pyridoxal phosphate-dependent enzyme, partial [Sphingobacteriales bacterium]
TQLAQQHNAINLAQGFPSFNPPAELMELVSKYMKDGWNQYAPMPGLLQLRQKIAQKTERLYGYAPNPDTEITVTSGATEALFAAITAVVHPGDEVIIFEPAYDSYAPAVILAGGTPVYIPLQAPTFHINWDEVKEKLSLRTKLIIFNNPHNPTGAVYGAEDLQEMILLLQHTQAYLISDEVYEHIVFDERVHQSVLSVPELRERAFVISSFGKTYHNTGWKVGYCIAPPALTTELRKMHQFMVFSTSTPFQLAIADFMENATHYLELPAFYQQKRDFFCDLLKNTKFRFLPAAGTYFQVADYSEITDENDKDFAARLTRETGVATIPVSAFNHDGRDEKLLRFCFAKDEDVLRQAVEKLQRL